MSAFGLTAFKTTLVFDKKKNKLLATARDERVKMQQRRLLEAKKKREGSEQTEQTEDN